MSVKLIYGNNIKTCVEAEQLSGFCFSILNPTGKSYGDKIVADVTKVSVDLAPYQGNVTLDNPVEITLDYGIVSVESKTIRDVTFYNSLEPRTPMTQDFVVLPREPLMEKYDNVFHILLPERSDFLPSLQAICQPQKPDTKFKFRVVFTPKLPAVAYTTTFYMWLGVTPIKLRCHGFSEGPYVTVSQNILNFGCIYFGAEQKIATTMMNHSICDAWFQFDHDNFISPFSIFPICGKIGAKKSIKLEVYFRPYKPQSYYKRVYCLLHQQNPQYLDMVGLCIPRPYFILQPIQFCVSIADTKLLPIPNPSFEDYFYDDSWGVKLSQQEFKFGGLDAGSFGCPRPAHALYQFTLTNYLPYDIMVEWVPDPSRTFSITPPLQFINSQQAADFELHFTPSIPNVFYACIMECYIYPTTQIWPPSAGAPWVYSRKPEFHKVKSEAPHPAPTHKDRWKSPTPAEKPSEKPSETSVSPRPDGSKKDPIKTGMLDQVRIGNLDSGRREATKTTSEKSVASAASASSVFGGDRKAGRIPFELFIFNRDTSLKVSVPPKRHYRQHPIDLYAYIDPEEPPIMVRIEELPTTAGEDEEEEMDTAPTQTEDSSADVSKKGKKKKKKGKKGKKDKKGKKKGKKDKKDKKKKKGKKGETGTTTADTSATQSETETDVEKKGKKKDKKGKKDKKEKKEKKGKKGKKGKKDKKKKKKGKKSKKKLVDSTEEEMEEMEYEEEEEEEEPPPPEIPPEPPLEKRVSFEIFDQCKKPDDETPGTDPPCPNELALPLCLTLRATGHTYQPAEQPPIPHFSIPSRVTMGPTLPQHREFRTVLLKNTNDIPLAFELRDFDKSDIFEAKPKIGVVPPENQQIVMVSMNTHLPYTEPYNHVANFNLNAIDDNAVSLIGYAEVPSLIMSFLSDPSRSVTEIICPTTVPGFATYALVTLKNPSRFHYKFILTKYEPNDPDTFTPTPSDGILAPYDIMTIKWKFVPRGYEIYRVPWTFHFEVMGAKSEESFWNAVYEFLIPLVGEGSPCQVTVQPSLLDFDLVKIFESKTKAFKIVNVGTSLVSGFLHVKHEQWLQHYIKTQVTLSPTEVLLEPGASIEVLVTIRPDKPILYNFTVAFSLLSPEKDVQGLLISDPCSKDMVEIRFIGDHVLAQVNDIQQIARHAAWGVDQAWNMFSLDELNEYLNPISHAAREGVMPHVPTVTFEFPSAPASSPPAIFSLVLKNQSDTYCHWQLVSQPPKNSRLYQLQQKTKPEMYQGQIDAFQDNPRFLTALWTQKYQNPSDASHLSNMASTKSVEGGRRASLALSALKNSENFRIIPSIGSIPPRQHQVITFRFSYDGEHMGGHKMPVLLRIYPAIFIWVDLKAKILKADSCDLQMKTVLKLHPIALNDLDPPIQTLWMYNGGTVSVPFIADTEPFKKLQRENFGHGVIECLTPEGVALPKTWTPFKLRFSPLEFKKYSTHIKIHPRFLSHIVGIDIHGSTSVTEDIDLRPPAKLDKSLISDPMVPVIICPRRIIFPHFLPTGDRSTSLIYLTNTSRSHSFSFAWPESTLVNLANITFLPDIGILAPGEQCACQVILKAGSVNQIMNTTVRCWIEDVTSIDQYNVQHKMYKGEIVEYREVVVFTKKGPQKVKEPVTAREPNKPEPYSRLLTISCYIGSVFGRIDYITPKEQTRMTFSDPIGLQPLPAEGEGDGIHKDKRLLILSPSNRHLARDILSQILWDLTQLSPNWASNIREMAKRHEVYFEDYKNSEESTDVCEEMMPAYHLPRKTEEEILEFSLFNMFQEMADRFANNQPDWANLAPGVGILPPP